MRQVPLVTSILLRYKVTLNLCLPAERLHCIVILSVGHIRAVLEVENNIALTVTVCVALFEVVGELQRERLCHSSAAAFS